MDMELKIGIQIIGEIVIIFLVTVDIIYQTEVVFQTIIIVLKMNILKIIIVFLIPEVVL